MANNAEEIWLGCYLFGCLLVCAAIGLSVAAILLATAWRIAT